MRRRDATDQSLFLQQRSGWPPVVCTGLSIGLHALLLGAATFAVLSGPRPTELIRVSLVSGGRAGGTAPPGAAAAAPAETTVAHSAPPEPPKQPRVRQAPHGRIAALAHHPETERRDRTAPLAADVVPSGATARGTFNSGTIGGPGGGGVGHGNGAGSAAGGGDGSDQRAACVYCPEPRYPLIARARGWQGSVDVGLVVRADGTVNAARLRRSSGYGVLDEAAIAVARHSRFSPPAAQGLPAPLHGRIRYRFELTTAR
jgi:TonB family protein